MHKFSTGSLEQRHGSGFSLVEMLVVVFILGLSASIAVPGLLFVLRRERVNAIALEFAGWLEEARSQSAQEVNQGLLALGESDSNSGGCAIILSGPISTAKTGDTIATITGDTANDCNVRQKSLIIPETQGDRFKIAAYGLGSGVAAGDSDNPCAKTNVAMACVGSVSLFFTPRGMWSSTSLEANQNLEIRIAHSDGKGPKRCVRVSSILGSIDIGRSGDGNIASSCSEWQKI